MAAIELTIAPALGSRYALGGFVAFGLGSDVDQALDYASTSDRLAVGDSGLIPSAAAIDPAGARIEHPEAIHPLTALGRALDGLTDLEPGQLVAQAVQPLSDFRHRRVRVALDDPTLLLPDEPGIIEHPGPALTAALVAALASGQAPPTAAEHLVQVELLRAPRRKFKAVAQSFGGPAGRRFGVYRDQDPVPAASFANQSEARRWAMAAARDRQAMAMVLEIRPHLVRNDGDPFLRVERRCVSQKAALRATLAEAKRPDRVRTHGWLFSGRVG